MLGRWRWFRKVYCCQIVKKVNTIGNEGELASTALRKACLWSQQLCTPACHGIWSPVRSLKSPCHSTASGHTATQSLAGTPHFRQKLHTKRSSQSWPASTSGLDSFENIIFSWHSSCLLLRRVLLLARRSLLGHDGADMQAVTPIRSLVLKASILSWWSTNV